MQADNAWTGHSGYLDFELEIGPGSGREYPLLVVRSPAGETRETMHFPYDQPALDSRLKDLQIALLRASGTRRRMPSVEEQTVQDFGRSLFDALLTGEVRTCYDVSLGEAAQQGKGLRIRLPLRPQTPPSWARRPVPLTALSSTWPRSIRNSKKALKWVQMRP